MSENNTPFVLDELHYSELKGVMRSTLGQAALQRDTPLCIRGDVEHILAVAKLQAEVAESQEWYVECAEWYSALDALRDMVKENESSTAL